MRESGDVNVFRPFDRGTLRVPLHHLGFESLRRIQPVRDRKQLGMRRLRLHFNRQVTRRQRLRCHSLKFEQLRGSVRQREEHRPLMGRVLARHRVRAERNIILRLRPRRNVQKVVPGPELVFNRRPQLPVVSRVVGQRQWDRSASSNIRLEGHDVGLALLTHTHPGQGQQLILPAFHLTSHPLYADIWIKLTRMERDIQLHVLIRCHEAFRGSHAKVGLHRRHIPGELGTYIPGVFEL
mmetsp:Transcript_4016/g.4578  ORF Transcript_4016/g.4578 Transcript_4016/m.4578 type:complete len:238 (-) Transcript_4016:832-1545(-)